MTPTYTAPPSGGKRSHTPAQLASALSATLLVGASATFGAHYAYNQGIEHGRLMALAAVAFALGLELAKPLAVVGMIETGRRWEIGRAGLLAVLAAVAIVYSLTAELQLMAKSRADSVAERTRQALVAADARRARDEARRDIDGLGPTRPAVELAPLLAAAQRTAGDCTRIVSKAQREACTVLPLLESEAARGARHADASERLVKAEEALARAGAPKVADPGAQALASFLGALGWSVPADRIGDWLVLVAVLALEVGSALAGLLCAPARRTTTEAELPSANIAEVVPDKAGVHGEQRQGQRGTADTADQIVTNTALARPEQPRSQRVARTIANRQAAANAIKAELRRHGGRSSASVRELARRLGARPTTVHVALGSLLAAGTVERVGSTLVLNG